MSSLQIACNLTASDLAAVRERYRTAASQYAAIARISDDLADIALTGDKTVLRALLDEMIARERACCPFLAFDVAESSEGFRVNLRVLDGPELAQGILHESVAAFFPGATVLD